MSEFTFLFRGGEAPSSPEAFQQRMQRWSAWAKELREKGHLKGGSPLEEGGKVVKGSQRTVTDGPFAESKDLVGGFMAIEARDLDQAVQLSLGCPIFEGGGAVEVRPVMQM